MKLKNMSEVELCELVMEILHQRDGTSKTDVRLFRENFSVSTLACAIVWFLLKKTAQQ